LQLGTFDFVSTGVYDDRIGHLHGGFGQIGREQKHFPSINIHGSHLKPRNLLRNSRGIVK
jgi:hypothetical protein